MEEASEALARTDYFACEKLCLQALDLARDSNDYERYARILLPLQESRRLRRQAAADAGTFILTAELSPQAILDQHPAGCLLLTDPPYTDEHEQAIRQLAFERELNIEVLLMGPKDLRQAFEQHAERVGDAAVAAVPNHADPTDRIEAYWHTVQRVGDHEIAHQRLAQAARDAAREAAKQNAEK
jgi:hypothetical protein